MFDLEKLSLRVLFESYLEIYTGSSLCDLEIYNPISITFQ